MSISHYTCVVCKTPREEIETGRCMECDNTLCVHCLINSNIKSNDALDYGYIYDSKNPKLMKQYEKEGYELYTTHREAYYNDGEVIGESSITKLHCPLCTNK